MKSLSELIESKAFFFLFVGLFSAIALYSFETTDPASLQTTGHQLNHAGYLGALISDLFFYHWGIAAWGIPFGFLFSAFIPAQSQVKIFFATVGAMLCVAFYAQALSFESYLPLQHYPAGASGIIGKELCALLQSLMGQSGSLVFIHLLFFQTLNTLSFQYLLRTLEYLGSTFKKIFIFLLKKLWTQSQEMKPTVVSKKDTKKKKYSQEQPLTHHWTEEESRGWSEQAQKLSEQLTQYGIENKVTAIVPGPVVVRFELQLACGERSSKVVTLGKDLARSLLISHLNVIENIPGTSCIGIEVAQNKRQTLTLEPLLDVIDPEMTLPLALGVQTQAQPLIADLAKLPHLLVAGSTGSGKSVGITSMLLSLIEHNRAEKMKLILVDPKVLEFAKYENLGHLALPIISEHEQALAALNWCVELMESRYRLLAKLKVRHIKDYQLLAKKNKNLVKMPYIVVVIDELADLMMLSKKAVEQPIARLAQKARACGIHLIIATQRPSVDIITGLIKANIPARLSYAVSSKIDSRTILDQAGAESLLGMGDGYFIKPGHPHKIRLHGAFISDQEIEERLKEYKLEKPEYLAEIKDLQEALEQLS